MHAAGDAIGEVRDLLRVQRIARVGDDDAVLAVGGALAREHHVTPVGRRLHVVHEARVDDDRVDDLRIAGLLMSIAYTRSPPPCVPRYATFPFGWIHTSDVGNSVLGNRPTTVTDRLNVARLEVNHRARLFAAEVRGDEIVARLVADERAVLLQLAIAG